MYGLNKRIQVKHGIVLVHIVTLNTQKLFLPGNLTVTSLHV